MLNSWMFKWTTAKHTSNSIGCILVSSRHYNIPKFPMYSISSHSSFGIFDCHLKKSKFKKHMYKQHYSGYLMVNYQKVLWYIHYVSALDLKLVCFLGVTVCLPNVFGDFGLAKNTIAISNIIDAINTNLGQYPQFGYKSSVGITNLKGSKLPAFI